MSKDGEDPWTERDRTLPRQTGEGPEQEPEELYKAGIFLLKRDKTREALVAFRHALAIRGAEPKYMSFYGLSLALVEGKLREALGLCEKAVGKEFYRPELYLNLGRVYLMAGNRKKAHMALRKGLALDRENMEIRSELERMGVRRPPVFPFLDRRNPANKVAGKVLHRLRLR